MSRRAAGAITGAILVGLALSATALETAQGVVVRRADGPEDQIQYEIQDVPGFFVLPDLPGDRDSAAPVAVSDDGSVVVANGLSTSGPEAFRWAAATGAVGLGDLPGGGFASRATHASRDGAVIVGTSDVEEGRVPFRWRAATGMERLLPALQTADCAPEVMTPDGSLVAGTCMTLSDPSLPNDARGFVWTEAHGVAWLGTTAERGGRWNAVSDDGSVLLRSWSSSQERLEAGPDGRFGTDDDRELRWRTLGGDIWSTPDRMFASADARVVVSTGAGVLGFPGFPTRRWTVGPDGVAGTADDTSENISTRSRGRASCAASGVSADGSTVIGDCHSGWSGTPHPARWTQRTGWTRLTATTSASFGSGFASAVSADGSEIAGWFTIVSDSSWQAGSPRFKPFYWTAERGISFFATATVPGSSTRVLLSRDGAAVLGPESTAAGDSLFLWRAGRGRVHVGDLPDGPADVRAHALSLDGRTVVGQSRSAAGRQVFRWTDGGESAPIGAASRAPWRAFVSDDGSTVAAGFPWGMTSGYDPDAPPFRWDLASGRVRRIGLPKPFPGCWIEQLSGDGSTVAGACRSGIRLWWFVQSAALGLKKAPALPLDPSFELTCRIQALSFDGSRVALSCGDGGTEAAHLWLPATQTRVRIDPIGFGLDTVLRGLSADGRIVLGEVRPPNGGGNAFLGKPGWEDIIGIDDHTFEPLLLSRGGSTAIGRSDSALYRYRTATGFEGIERPVGVTPYPNAIVRASEDGVVVVGIDPEPTEADPYEVPEGVDVYAPRNHYGGPSPFDAPSPRIWISDPVNGGRWLDEVLTAAGVDLSGWSLDQLVAISDDGTRILGNGTDPSGARRAWLAVLPPPAP